MAPPGIGKTVIACSIIGKRKVRTLILVQRKQLMDQWKSRLSDFLTVTPEKIGVLSGNTKKMTGVIDIAMLQTLTRMKEAKDLLSILGMPIAFKGRVVQYAGRLHRKTAGKSNVLIYDYLDKSSGLTISMFRKRIAAYKKMGYRIEINPDMETDHGEKQGDLFGYLLC